MALVHEFENSGNWLFKRRGWLPVILVIAGVIMMYLGNRQALIFDLRDEMIFLAISLCGELIRIITVGYAPKNTSGRNTAAGQIAEEQFLRRKFGEAYDKWSEKVSAFIPFTFKYIPSKLSFSVRNVLKREYNSIVNIFIVFTLLDVCRNYILTGRLFFTPVWIYSLAGAAGLWLIVFLIHKLTRWLEVEGR